MSYTVANPGGTSRPATVTAASGLLYFAAAIQLITIVLSFFAFGPIQEVINEQFADTPEAGAVATGMRVGIIFGIAINALFAAGTIVCAVLDGRGKNPARIVTWVLGGIAVLCYACNLVGTALSSSLTNMGGTSPEQTEIQRRIEDALPAWQSSVDLVTSILLILAFGGAMILLALPQSNAFFRKEQEVWVPPTYPGGGGYPPAPGQADPYGQPPAQPGEYPPPGQPGQPGQYPPGQPGQYPPPGQFPPSQQ
jgi:hypothetical protein